MHNRDNLDHKIKYFNKHLCNNCIYVYFLNVHINISTKKIYTYFTAKKSSTKENISYTKSIKDSNEDNSDVNKDSITSISIKHGIGFFQLFCIVI